MEGPQACAWARADPIQVRRERAAFPIEVALRTPLAGTLVPAAVGHLAVCPKQVAPPAYSADQAAACSEVDPTAAAQPAANWVEEPLEAQGLARGCPSLGGEAAATRHLDSTQGPVRPPLELRTPHRTWPRRHSCIRNGRIRSSTPPHSNCRSIRARVNGADQHTLLCHNEKLLFAKAILGDAAPLTETPQPAWAARRFAPSVWLTARRRRPRRACRSASTLEA